MLLYSKNHFIHSLSAVLNGQEGPGPEEGRRKLGESMTQRIHDFASDESGHGPGSEVWIWNQSDNSHAIVQGFNRLVAGRGPRDGQRVVYVDGGFDLFSSGHIEFLRLVHEAEEEAGKARGWDDDVSKQARLHKYGEDYRPAYIIAGIHDDLTVNRWKGANYPIMNIFERGLCALQCKVSPIPPSLSLGETFEKDRFLDFWRMTIMMLISPLSIYIPSSSRPRS